MGCCGDQGTKFKNLLDQFQQYASYSWLSFSTFLPQVPLHRKLVLRAVRGPWALKRSRASQGSVHSHLHGPETKQKKIFQHAQDEFMVTTAFSFLGL